MQPTLVPSRPPNPPETPVAPEQPDASAATTAAPRTAREIAGLRRQRDELVEQLTGTHARRSELVTEMDRADAGSRGVLKQQMVELDRRVLQLERDVSTIDHAIASAPAALAADGPSAWFSSPSVASPDGFVVVGPHGPSSNAVSLLLLVLIALQVARFVRGRPRRDQPRVDPLLSEAAARLARVEQAVEAIAIEVERVSEGQRFVAQTLGERAGSATRYAPVPRREHLTPT